MGGKRAHERNENMQGKPVPEAIASCYSGVLTFEHASESSGGLVKTQIAGPQPQSSWLSRSGLGPKDLYLSQIPRSKMPVRGPHFENHCYCVMALPQPNDARSLGFLFLWPCGQLTLLGLLWQTTSVHSLGSLSHLLSFVQLLSISWFDSKLKWKQCLCIWLWCAHIVVWPSSLGRCFKSSFMYIQTELQKKKKEIIHSGSQS